MDPENTELQAAVARAKQAIDDAGLEYAKRATADKLRAMEKDKSLEDADVEQALSRTLWRCPPGGCPDPVWRLLAQEALESESG